MVKNDHRDLNPGGIIIVLGSPNDGDGGLSSIAMERCAQALAEFRRNPDFAILPTGGWGTHFNTTDKPHAFYVQKELLARGIPEKAFLPFVKSSNTLEDASLSGPILDTYPGLELIVVTSDFHAARARYIFEHQFPERSIRISACGTELPQDALIRLQAHEDQALEELKKRPGGNARTAG